VIDLTTKKRTVIDKPGHIHGYCWSSDGSKVAYTWQLPLRQPEDAVERKTYLITCDPDGTNQKTVTMRKYEVPAPSTGTNYDGITLLSLGPPRLGATRVDLRDDRLYRIESRSHREGAKNAKGKGNE
jgi:Tol biopolymer transport system component